MEVNYDAYLDSETKKVIGYLSAYNADEGEAEAVITAFTYELSNNVAKKGNFVDCEPILYYTSLIYIDDMLAEIFGRVNATRDDNEKALRLCVREKDLVELFNARKWHLPNLKNRNLDNCFRVLKDRGAAISIIEEITQKDNKIDELLGRAKKELNVKILDDALLEVERLANDIESCRKMGIPIPNINNSDTESVKKSIEGIKRLALQKEELTKNILDVDSRIYVIITQKNATLSDIDKFIHLCNQQSKLLSDCRDKNWPIPMIRYENPESLINQYKHYSDMIDLDRIIQSSRDNLSDSGQYKSFYENCTQQDINIGICKNNNWPLPELRIKNPLDLSKSVKKEERAYERAKKFKRIKTRIIFGAILFTTIIIGAFTLYTKGKVRIPFNSASVVGKNYEDVRKRLKKAGFNDAKIQEVEDEAGWFEREKVISVTIDGNAEYSKWTYKKKDADIIINYSSKDRVYITDILTGWENSDYQDIKKILNENGFKNVSLEESDTTDKSESGKIKRLSLNNIEYSNEDCYIPRNAPIKITYYEYKVTIGESSDEIIGQNYLDVREKLLHTVGFNVKGIQESPENGGWKKPGYITEISIDNKKSFGADARFKPDSKIIIKYSSGDRKIITPIVSDFKSKQYTEIMEGLTSEGITNVHFNPIETTQRNQNNLVSNIIIDNNNYDSGECHVRKNAEIVVDYYALKTVQINKKKEAFLGKDYKEVKTELENLGFTNITLKRNNSLTTGWIDKEGSVKSILISNNENYNEFQRYDCDIPIEIEVNTFKDRGCEDITLVK